MSPILKSNADDLAWIWIALKKYYQLSEHQEPMSSLFQVIEFSNFEATFLNRAQLKSNQLYGAFNSHGSEFCLESSNDAMTVGIAGALTKMYRNRISFKLYLGTLSMTNTLLTLTDEWFGLFQWRIQNKIVFDGTILFPWNFEISIIYFYWQ